MTIKSAKKVAKRGWSLDKFTTKVTGAAKKAEVPAKKISKAKIAECYEGNVTVKDTVSILSA